MSYYAAINPECAQNKCGNCDGRAMCQNPQCDGIHACQHHCHDKPQVMYEAKRCPDHEDGGHRLINQGRDVALYGDRFTCSCGRTEIANTDEHKARFGAA